MCDDDSRPTIYEAPYTVHFADMLRLLLQIALNFRLRLSLQSGRVLSRIPALFHTVSHSIFTFVCVVVLNGSCV